MDRAERLTGPKVSRWPDPENGPYSLRLTVAVLDGRPQVVGVELWGVDPLTYVHGAEPLPAPESDTAITSSELRGLKLGELLKKFLDAFTRESDLILGASSATEGLKTSVAEHQSQVTGAPSRRGRRPTYGPPFFAQVAKVYTDAMAQGRPPTSTVAEWGHVNKSTAAKWVARCRDLHFLPKTTKGRAAVNVAQEREES